MTVISDSLYVRNLTDRIGIGVTLVPGGGVLATVTGPTWQYVTADPNGVETARVGSLASQNNGTLWINTNGVTAWSALSSASSGFALPNDVIGSWGTTSPLQVESVYVSASNRFDLRGDDVSQATSQAGTSFRIFTGQVTMTGAAAGAASGNLSILTGPTDCTNAGGTSGATGTLTIGTGSAFSTLGSSGNSGAFNLTTGASEDGNSGSISITTGTAAGVRGVLDINVDTIDTATQSTAFLLIDNTLQALAFGVVGTNIMTISTVNGAEAVTFLAGALTNLPIASRTATDGEIDAGFFLKKSFSAGASSTDVVLPARVGGWRVVDAYIRSIGATGGTLTVQTAGGVANVTDAMIPGNAGAITRCATILGVNSIFASGATIRFAAAAGAPAGEAFVRIEPQ